VLRAAERGRVLGGMSVALQERARGGKHRAGRCGREDHGPATCELRSFHHIIPRCAQSLPYEALLGFLIVRFPVPCCAVQVDPHFSMQLCLIQTRAQ
jgi:hypothetical protein